MSEEEMNDALVIVFIAELDQEYVARIAAQVSFLLLRHFFNFLFHQTTKKLN
jgi:hypothetical protein